MTHSDFIALVATMRREQRLFNDTLSRAAFNRARDLERLVDLELSTFVVIDGVYVKQPTLF